VTAERRLARVEADSCLIDAILTGLVGPVTQRRRRRCAVILIRGIGSMQERGV